MLRKSSILFHSSFCPTLTLKHDTGPPCNVETSEEIPPPGRSVSWTIELACTSRSTCVVCCIHVKEDSLRCCVVDTSGPYPRELLYHLTCFSKFCSTRSLERVSVPGKVLQNFQALSEPDRESVNGTLSRALKSRISDPLLFSPAASSTTTVSSNSSILELWSPSPTCYVDDLTGQKRKTLSDYDGCAFTDTSSATTTTTYEGTAEVGDTTSTKVTIDLTESFYEYLPWEASGWTVCSSCGRKFFKKKYDIYCGFNCISIVKSNMYCYSR